MQKWWQWIVSNARIGGLSFGGSGRALLYQEEVVDRRRWLSEDEFYEVLTVAQLLPGPNLVNLAAYLSRRIFPRSLWLMPAAILALAVPGALFAILLVVAVDIENPWIKILFKGFSLGSIALFLVFVLRLLKHVVQERGWKRVGRSAVALTVGGMSLGGVPLMATLLVGIGLGLLVEFSE